MPGSLFFASGVCFLRLMQEKPLHHNFCDAEDFPLNYLFFFRMIP